VLGRQEIIASSSTANHKNRAEQCTGVGQERLGPSYFFISLVLGHLNSLLWYVPS
jgi:hypothetical protein